MSAFSNEQRIKRAKSKNDILIFASLKIQSVNTVCEKEQPVIFFPEKSHPLRESAEKFMLLMTECAARSADKDSAVSFSIMLNIPVVYVIAVFWSNGYDADAEVIGG